MTTTAQNNTTPAPPPKMTVAPPRMSLTGVRKGKIQMPLRVLVYGSEGCGKTTFCAGAPKPILLGADSGSMSVDIDRLPEPQTWQDVLDGIALLENEKHGYQSVVLDPLNWMEPLVFRQVTGGTCSIEEFGGGYGRGHAAALDHWRVLVAGTERLWKKGMNLLVTAHSQIRNFANPEGQPFDRYEIAMNAKAAGLWKQFVDFVLFARFETAERSLDKSKKRVIGVSTGMRLIHSSWTAAYDAKARVTLPPELPLSWEAFNAAVDHGRGRAAENRARIAELIEQLGDKAVAAKVQAYVADAGDDANRLDEIANAVLVKLEEKRVMQETLGNDQIPNA